MINVLGLKCSTLCLKWQIRPFTRLLHDGLNVTASYLSDDLGPFLSRYKARYSHGLGGLDGQGEIKVSNRRRALDNCTHIPLLGQRLQTLDQNRHDGVVEVGPRGHRVQVGRHRQKLLRFEYLLL